MHLLIRSPCDLGPSPSGTHASLAAIQMALLHAFVVKKSMRALSIRQAPHQGWSAAGDFNLVFLLPSCKAPFLADAIVCLLVMASFVVCGSFRGKG